MLHVLLRTILMVAMMFGVLAGAGAQERKIALVIGNARYAAVPLNNPENDARLISANLRKLGFEVAEHLNLGVRDFRRVLREFARRVQDDQGVSVLYYAGHGVQIDGRNYLLPVDINLRDEEEIKDESVDIDELFLSRLDKARASARIVILDACRDNPFAGKTRNLRQTGGLAEMAARGALIAYSSAPGAAAEDGPPDSNSVYSRHLADEMLKEGLEIEQMFKNVRVKVLRDTNERQIPWVNTSLTVNFSFNPFKGPAPEELARLAQVRRLEAELAHTRKALDESLASARVAQASAPVVAITPQPAPAPVIAIAPQPAPAPAPVIALAPQPSPAPVVVAAPAHVPAAPAATVAAQVPLPALPPAVAPPRVAMIDPPPLRLPPAPLFETSRTRAEPPVRLAVVSRERGLTPDRRTGGRDGSARCSDLLHRASVGDQLGADEEAYLLQECRK